MNLPAPARAGSYGAIVSDPPWRYDNAATRNAADAKYDTLTIAELKSWADQVNSWVIPGGHLYLWTTTNFLPRSFSLLRAWGFDYVTNLVWVKPQMGMGNYFRVSHEHVLFGLKQPRTRTRSRKTKSWFEADRTRHSAKPEAFYDLVEASSWPPYVDMFSRRQARLNGHWDTWGLEAQ